MYTRVVIKFQKNKIFPIIQSFYYECIRIPDDGIGVVFFLLNHIFRLWRRDEKKSCSDRSQPTYVAATRFVLLYYALKIGTVNKFSHIFFNLVANFFSFFFFFLGSLPSLFGVSALAIFMTSTSLSCTDKNFASTTYNTAAAVQTCTHVRSAIVWPTSKILSYHILSDTGSARTVNTDNFR